MYQVVSVIGSDKQAIIYSDLRIFTMSYSADSAPCCVSLTLAYGWRSYCFDLLNGLPDYHTLH